MATIIHDPTIGWLLLTEKWPKRPYEEINKPPQWWFDDEKADYQKAVAHCLSTAIEIDEKDEDAMLELVDPTGDNFQNSHPYSVDAEFEVVTQQLRYDNWKPKEIARLVKAKEKWQPKDPGPAGHFNPTDSVTSDGTKWVEPNEWTKHGHFETKTESQDELWDEVYQRLTGDNNGSFLSREDQLSVIKSRFRIERI